MASENFFSSSDPITVTLANVNQTDSKPAASGFSDGNIIFDKTEQKFYQAVSGSWILLDFIGDDFTVNKLAFNTAATETLSVGELAWNADDETVDMHVGDNVTIQLGQEMVYHVVNQTGSQIDNGTVVMADGALGASGKIKVVPAIADGSVPAKYIMGVATEDIPNGALGYVTAFGKVRGFNTSSYSSGTVLYASSTSSGSFTDTAPSLPNQKVTVAITLDQKSNGNIFVRPTYDDRRKSVSSISDLENVNTTENDVVYLDAGDRSGWFKWDNSNLSTEVSNDTAQAVYIPPSSDATGASGAWVRDYDDYLNALWFGIVRNDNTVDNTSAITNALTYLKSIDGGTLYFPEGYYCIDDEIVFDADGLNFVGAGESVTRFYPINDDVTKAMFRWEHASNARIRYGGMKDLSIIADPRESGLSGADDRWRKYGLHIFDSFRLTFENLRIDHFHEDGVKFEESKSRGGPDQIYFNNVHVSVCTQAGYDLSSTGHSTHIIGGTIDFNGYGIYAGGRNSIYVDHVDIEENNLAGVYFYSGLDYSLLNCTFENNARNYSTSSQGKTHIHIGTLNTVESFRVTESYLLGDNMYSGIYIEDANSTGITNCAAFRASNFVGPIVDNSSANANNTYVINLLSDSSPGGGNIANGTQYIGPITTTTTNTFTASASATTTEDIKIGDGTWLISATFIGTGYAHAATATVITGNQTSVVAAVDEIGQSMAFGSGSLTITEYSGLTPSIFSSNNGKGFRISATEATGNAGTVTWIGKRIL